MYSISIFYFHFTYLREGGAYAPKRTTGLKYKHTFQIKYTEAILSKSTRKLLWFEVTKMLIAVLKLSCYLL